MKHIWTEVVKIYHTSSVRVVQPRLTSASRSASEVMSHSVSKPLPAISVLPALSLNTVRRVDTSCAPHASIIPPTLTLAFHTCTPPLSSAAARGAAPTLLCLTPHASSATPPPFVPRASILPHAISRSPSRGPRRSHTCCRHLPLCEGEERDTFNGAAERYSSRQCGSCSG